MAGVTHLAINATTIKKMKWWERIVEKWKKLVEETARANEKMWQGKPPSCCSKDKD